MRNIRKCKECGKMLPNGNSIISYAARKLGYCRYCYKMNFPRRPERVSHRLPDDTVPEFEDGAGVFHPETPWDWYEYFFPERDR